MREQDTRLQTGKQNFMAVFLIVGGRRLIIKESLFSAGLKWMEKYFKNKQLFSRKDN